MAKRYKYDYGLPFSEALAKNLDRLYDRVFLNNMASMLILDGGVGQGKTTLAVHIADYLQKKPIVFKKQLSMGGDDFQEKLRSCFEEKLKVIIYDEAGDFNRRGALTRFNAELNRVFETFRAFKIIVILVLPSFEDLDNGLMKKQICRMLIRVYGRKQNYGNFKAYSLYRMFWVKHYMDKMTVKPQAYSRVDPNIYGHWLDLPPTRSDELSMYSTEGKFNVLSHNVMKKKGLLTFKDLAYELKRSEDWVKKKSSLLNIQSLEVHNCRKYFSPDVIKLLKGELKYV